MAAVVVVATAAGVAGAAVVGGAVTLEAGEEEAVAATREVAGLMAAVAVVRRTRASHVPAARAVLRVLKVLIPMAVNTGVAVNGSHTTRRKTKI